MTNHIKLTLFKFLCSSYTWQALGFSLRTRWFLENCLDCLLKIARTNLRQLIRQYPFEPLKGDPGRRCVRRGQQRRKNEPTGEVYEENVSGATVLLLASLLPDPDDKTSQSLTLSDLFDVRKAVKDIFLPYFAKALRL